MEVLEHSVIEREENNRADVQRDLGPPGVLYLVRVYYVSRTNSGTIENKSKNDELCHDKAFKTNTRDKH